MSVGGFLTYKAFHRVEKDWAARSCIKVLCAITDGLDEKLFTFWKAERQCVVESG